MADPHPRKSSLLLLLLLLLLLFLGLVALDNNQEVVAVWGDHHVVNFARDSQESQIVLWVQIAHQTASGYRELTQAHCVCRSLSRLSHR